MVDAEKSVIIRVCYVLCAISENEHLSSEDLKFFSEIPEDFICDVCRSEDEKVDFLMGMKRIKKVGIF